MDLDTWAVHAYRNAHHWDLKLDTGLDNFTEFKNSTSHIKHISLNFNLAEH